MKKSFKEKKYDFKIKRAVDIFMKSGYSHHVYDLATKYCTAANYAIEKYDYLDYKMMRNQTVYNFLTKENRKKYIDLMLSYEPDIQLSDILLGFILNYESQLDTETSQLILDKLFSCNCPYNEIYCYNEIKMNKYYVEQLIYYKSNSEEAFDYIVQAHSIMDTETYNKMENCILNNARLYTLIRYVQGYQVEDIKLLIKRTLYYNNALLYYEVLKHLQNYNKLNDKIKKELIKKIIDTGDKEYILKTAVDIENSMLDNFTVCDFMGAVDDLELDEEDRNRLLTSAFYSLSVHNKNKYIDENIGEKTKTLKK